VSVQSDGAGEIADTFKKHSQTIGRFNTVIVVQNGALPDIGDLQHTKPFFL
jgi:hypothetical protein